MLAGEVEQPRGRLLVQHPRGVGALADAAQGLLPEAPHRREEERGVVLHDGAAEALVRHAVHAPAGSRLTGFYTRILRIQKTFILTCIA